ncbi:MAG: peptidoglycan DD-metalloendopeptidase family protein [Pontiella sp.]|nr:peptidoglycan DD-metalloendopeptidase family protein [Pontiella sp.]
MNKTVFRSVLFLIVIGSLHVEAASQRKLNMSIEDAQRAISDEAMGSPFPADCKLLKMSSMKLEGVYYHIFITYLKTNQMWRSLVFDNRGRFMGYYETIEEPMDVDADAIVFSSVSDAGDASGFGAVSGTSLIEFDVNGPPDTADLDEDTYSFISSPGRDRPGDPAFRFVEVTQRLIDAVYYGRYQRIRDDFSDRAQEKLSAEQAEELFRNLREKFGRVRNLGDPELRGGNIAVFPVSFRKGILGLKVTLNEQDQIDELSLLPYQMAFPDLEQHKTMLTLPFGGRWRTLWGGGTEKTSRHFSDRNRQHALEFVIADRYGITHQKDGRWKADQYYAYGRPVLAPADGKVVQVVREVEDNKPGTENPFSRFGNMVVIEHATNEFSVIGHLMYDSITVNTGDVVKVRQQIALCGNSGDSLQPSIYYHLQDSPRLQNSRGYSPVFQSVLVWKRGRGTVEDLHEPVRGEYIEQHALAPEE